MLINKIGYQHLEAGTNCQDFGIEIKDTLIKGYLPNRKLITDGCSSCIHSEVGAKLFCKFMSDGTKAMYDAFKEINQIFKTKEDISNYALFTSWHLAENDTEFLVHGCGDGIIIKQKHNDKFEYEFMDYDNAPPYYMYNFIDPKYLLKYGEGVNFELKTYSKEDYKAIGIATDGLQYIIHSIYKDEFEEALMKRKPMAINRLINRVNYGCLRNVLPITYAFKDDITIAI